MMKTARTLLTVGTTAALLATAAFTTALPSIAESGYATTHQTTTGYIIGNEPGSRVNIRNESSVYAASPSYGLVGDRVQILSGTIGQGGYYWYYVKFSSGVEGWIRADFIYEEPTH